MRRLLSSAAFYGVSDIIVLAVGGFLLLPLYTRTLTQAEFGTYVIVRANAEIFTYLLYFGMPSAVARVYFDFRNAGRHIEFMSSVANFFVVNLLVCGAILFFFGDQVWAALSPAVPAYPYLWFSVTIAAVGFFSALGLLWLRIEGRAREFAGLQVSASVALALTVLVTLVHLRMGLSGLLIALIVGAALPAAVLPWLFARRYRFAIDSTHIKQSLHYAVPIVIGYLAYFVLNRISMVILQRHVAVDQIAVFGLAQQLAAVVTIVLMAFGKAFQPAVYAADPTQALELMRKSGLLLMLLMFSLTSLVVLFASEILAFIAPRSYQGSHDILLVLSVSNMTYAFGLISDTALLYHRRPKTLVAISIIGAMLSASLSLWLIPQWQLLGAAAAIAISCLTMALIGQWLARRVSGHSYLKPMLTTLAATAALGLFAHWLHDRSYSLTAMIGIKIAAVLLLTAPVYFLFTRENAVIPCARC